MSIVKTITDWNEGKIWFDSDENKVALYCDCNGQLSFVVKVLG